METEYVHIRQFTVNYTIIATNCNPLQGGCWEEIAFPRELDPLETCRLFYRTDQPRDNYNIFCSFVKQSTYLVLIKAIMH